MKKRMKITESLLYDLGHTKAGLKLLKAVVSNAKSAQSRYGPGKKKPKITVNNFGQYNDPEVTSFHANGATISIAAACIKRAQLLVNIGNDGRTIAEARAEPGVRGKVEMAKYTYTLYSVKPFAVSIFVCSMENGETLTAVDSAETDYLAVIDTMLGSQYSKYKFLVSSNEAQYYPAESIYRTVIPINLTQYFKKIFADYYYKGINEASPAYLENFLGIIVDGEASQTITMNVVSNFIVRSVSSPP